MRGLILGSMSGRSKNNEVVDMRFSGLLIVLLLMSGCGSSGSNQLASSQPPSNNAPVASDVSVSTQAGAAVSGTLAASDLDGDSLTFVLVQSPSNGTVNLSGSGNRDFEYTPDGGFTGNDSFTYNANDGIANSNTATVTITVNTPPSVSPASYSTSDLATVTATVSATDVDGDTLTFSINTQPAQGAVTSLDAATGDFVYTPDIAADGADSFSVTASDGFATSAPGTISIEIFGWAGTQQLGSAAYDAFITKGLVIKNDGSQILVGSTKGQVASTPNAGGDDFFVRTTDRRGNETSIAQFGDAEDNNPRGLLARPQDDGYYIVSSGDGDNLYRFDEGGTEIFSVPLPVEAGTTLTIAAYWAATDDAGDLYVLSWLESSNPSVLHAGLVSRVNGTDGTLVWQRELLTSVDDPVNFFIDNSNRIAPRGIDFDSSGNLVISGEFWDTSSVRPCERCGFIAKLDSGDGTDLWVREPDAFANCGADGNGRFYRVTVAPDDSLYLNGLTNFSAFPGSDGLFAKYSADGTQELWRFCDNSGADTTSFFTDPLITADGGIINYGSVGDAASPPATNGGPSEAYVVLQKFDAGGSITWTRQIQATRGDGSAANMLAGSVAEDSDGILYITGGTDGELTDAANAGDFDAFVIRIGPDGTVQ
ncbi:MAG: cadherin-like domain-containing protein [Gammaproteobacteria bacterium]|nr:cadherin-like domain-containing protein [Gammaproteobacteria bacterium]